MMIIRAAFGLVLLGGSFYWARRDVRGALFFLAALLPLNHKELFGLGVWNLTVPRVALIGVLLGFFSSFVRQVDHRFPHRLKGLWQDKVFVLLALLWLVRLASIYWSRNLYASFALLAFYTAMIGIYFVLRWSNNLFGKSFLHNLLSFYLVVVLASGVWSVFQYAAFYLLNTTLPGAVWPTEYQPLRVGSLFWDINHYAAYLVTAIPTIGLLTVRKSVAEGIWKSKTWWLFFTFLLVVSGMTLSRSGWGGLFLALPLATLLLFIRRPRRKEGAYLAAFLGIVLVFAIGGSVFFGLPVVERLGTFFDVYNSDSIKAHMSVLRGSYELFRSHPILGTGYGSFSEHFGETSEAAFYFSKDPVRGNRVPPHSVWGGLLAETGILGFATFVALMTIILHKLFRGFWRQGEDWPYQLGGFCSILGLLFSGIFYSYSLIFFWFYTFLTFGLAAFSDDKN